jgi:hypothetical protein
MFKLTAVETKVVLFLIGALLLGLAVRQWRDRHPAPAAVQER